MSAGDEEPGKARTPLPDGGDERGFLGRWSARKRGADAAISAEAVVPGTGPDTGADVGPGTDPALARDAAAAPLVAPSPDVPHRRERDDPQAPGEAGDDAEDGSAPREAPVPTDADMPPIASLGAGSDLSAFFSKGVSATLRRAALRHVFAQPAYNVRDGLNDYDGDYTVFEPLGDTVTADMKYHAARHERDRLERERLALEDEAREREAHASASPDDRAAETEAETEARVDAEADTDPEGESDAETTAGDGADADGPAPDRTGTVIAGREVRADAQGPPTPATGRGGNHEPDATAPHTDRDTDRIGRDGHETPTHG